MRDKACSRNAVRRDSSVHVADMLRLSLLLSYSIQKRPEKRERRVLERQVKPRYFHAMDDGGISIFSPIAPLSADRAFQSMTSDCLGPPRNKNSEGEKKSAKEEAEISEEPLGSRRTKQTKEIVPAKVSSAISLCIIGIVRDRSSQIFPKGWISSSFPDLPVWGKNVLSYRRLAC